LGKRFQLPLSGSRTRGGVTSVRTTAPIFQLPLSGSLSGPSLTTITIRSFTFNSLSRDHRGWSMWRWSFFSSSLSTPSLGITRRLEAIQYIDKQFPFQLPLSGSLSYKVHLAEYLRLITFNSLSRDHA